VAGGGLAFLAVACPTCNLLVMTTLGMSGALSIFAPLQPFIGAAGIVLLAATLRRILRLAAPDGATNPRASRVVGGHVRQGLEVPVSRAPVRVDTEPSDSLEIT
jgi:hypothetical protein